MASKLAGALSWTSQYIFQRLGRAMLRPIFYQQFCRSGRVGTSLEICLRWWLEVLELELCQKHVFEEHSSDVVELFCDARGFLARLAAVVFIGVKFSIQTGLPQNVCLTCFVLGMTIRLWASSS